MTALSTSLARFISPAMRRMMADHREAYGRLPGADCPCDACQVTAQAPAAECRVCGDKGFVKPAVPFGASGWGQAVSCTACNRTDPAARRRMLEAGLAIPHHYWSTHALEGLDPGTPRDETEYWLRGEYETARWLVLNSTERGVGKTHAAAGAAMRWVAAGRPARWIVVPDWLAEVRAAPRRDRDADALVEALAQTPALVVLDDLNDPRTDWEEEVLFRVVNARYAWALPTIVTTNITEATMPATSRIWSRVFASPHSSVWVRSHDRRRDR